MGYFIIDVEADGPIPGLTDYSMVCFGAVYLDKEDKLGQTFYGELAPISKNWLPDALAISGFTRKEHEKFGDPYNVMVSFKEWVLAVNRSGRPIFIADNNGFDYMFIHWYFEHFLGAKKDPFGWSSRNLNDIFHGIQKDMRASFKYLRKTKHTHNPVDDAMGNAEAFLHMKEKMGLKI